MNYLELEIGGEKRGLKLGLGYLKHVTDAKKIKLDELFTLLRDSGAEALFLVPELIFLSLEYNYKRKKEAPEFDQDDVFDWIDDAGGVNSDIYKTFMESLTQSLGTDMGKETPQKKVATKK